MRQSICYLSNKRGVATKMLLETAILVIALIAVYLLVSSAISGAQRVSTSLLNKCPDGNLDPIPSCYCDGKQINTNLGKSGVEPQFCCGGKITNAPCPCLNINSCDDYKTLLKYDDQVRWCTENVCSKYFGDGTTICSRIGGSCIPTSINVKVVSK